MYLQHLSISGFRGIGSHLDLPLGHRTIIYGPNGSGKSNTLQAIAWAIYGKLPLLTGGVFTREDALVNDFLDDARAAVTLTLSDRVTITRTRDKQSSTTRGANPLSIPLEADDPQAATEQLIGLSLEEFFAAVLLHQETIRDFITTTPERRSATIDRMIGTYLLRSLVKAVDPRVPAKAIEEAEEAMKRFDRQLSQASVISREMIQKRKEEHGDPAGLSQLLEEIRQDLGSMADALGLPAPGATLDGLESGLVSVRQAQVDITNRLEREAGQLGTLKERYHQAAVTSWQMVRRRKEQYGDPVDLPNLLREIQEGLTPIVQKLGLPVPQATVANLEKSLADARQAQLGATSTLEKEVGQLGALKQRYQQAAVTSWQMIRQRREQYGDPANLPNLLREIQKDLTSIVGKLGLPVPQATVANLEKSLTDARQAQLRAVSTLEKEVAQLGTLKARYEQTSKEVIEDLSIPPELESRRTELQAVIRALNQEIPALTRQLNQRQATERDLAELRLQVRELPELRGAIEQVRAKLETLETTSKQGTLYNQILTAGQEYLEQAQPTHCPLCKQIIENLESLLSTLRRETPADVEKIRQEHGKLEATLVQERNRVERLEQKERQAQELETALVGFPEDLERQIKEKQEESERLTRELTTVQADITQIEGRIRFAAEHRRRLEVVLREIEKALGQPPGRDVANALERAIQITRREAADVEALDLQLAADKLAQAKQLGQILEEEAQLRQQLDIVLEEIEHALGRPPDKDVAGVLDKAILDARIQATEIQDLNFQPAADMLDRAKQICQIQEDEMQLRQKLDAVLEELKQVLGQALGEDVNGALDQAIQAVRKRIAEIQSLGFEPIARKLNRAKQLNEIQKDELRLREFESNYQTASQEKARLKYRIRRLTDLRNAVQDIAETTKRHQQTIVTGLLSALDIHRYYQQLDPHPAYRQLQIEPEITSKGTYNYWIKALTDDRSHGTYVQTRFSTAQANCAAIAIFLAVNQHLSKKLETIILDDPSQSMDPEHKMRLAQTLAVIPRQVIVATEDPQMFEFLVDAFETPIIHQLGSWAVEGASLVG